ncbi:MAG: type II toxin-antitoxin system VapC family toxin [Gemmatimonadales bacterium]
MQLIDSSLYIRAFREPAFGEEFRTFHRTALPGLVLSAVVASEVLIGALTPERERAFRRGILDPFQARRRLHVPTWSTWDRASSVDRRMRRRPAFHSRLDRRSFFQDILIATSARELGATVITLNTRDFEAIAEFIDITVAEPWPQRAV